jgi:hypothetical protein
MMISDSMMVSQTGTTDVKKDILEGDHGRDNSKWQRKRASERVVSDWTECTNQQSQTQVVLAL